MSQSEPLAALYSRLRKLTERYISADRKTADPSQMNEIEREIREVRAMIQQSEEGEVMTEPLAIQPGQCSYCGGYNCDCKNPDPLDIPGVREAQFLMNIVSHQDDAARFARAYGSARIIAAWKALEGE